MTFNDPVEIPGKVLPAGTYVFKLADSQSDRTIVEVFIADENQILATILAIANYRLDIPEKTLVTFEERSSGSPEALHSWFYPGDNYGIEFVYPKSEQPVRTVERSALVAAAPAPVPVPEPPPAPVAQALAPEPPTPRPDPVVEREEETVIVAETETEPEPVPAELPKTAGNFALFPLAGIVLLTTGFAAIRFAKQS